MEIKTTSHRRYESGAVFFYILLAVALLAALTYAVSRGGRGNTSTLTDQQAKLAAQEIIEYGNTVANAVQKLRLRGMDETQISFGNSVFIDGAGVLVNPPGHNANCISNSCEVFSPEGGNLIPRIMDKMSHTSFNSAGGHSWFKTIPIQDVGSSETDLIMQVQHIREEVCVKINTLLGVSSSNSLPATDSFDNSIFSGAYPAHADPIGDVATKLAGTTTHCAESNSVGTYRFHQVLIAR